MESKEVKDRDRKEEFKLSFKKCQDCLCRKSYGIKNKNKNPIRPKNEFSKFSKYKVKI